MKNSKTKYVTMQKYCASITYYFSVVIGKGFVLLVMEINYSLKTAGVIVFNVTGIDILEKYFIQ